MPIKPEAGETKDKFISRCIKTEIEHGKPQDQASAICYSIWGESQNMNKGNLLYEADFKEAVFDRESYSIKNVVLLGPTSTNNRVYTKDCMESAVSLFEGVQAFVDHPSLEEEKTGRRSIRNLAGKYLNARFEDGKVKADAKLLPNENGKLYMDIAETMPDIAGNSQNAQGKWRKDGGKQIVEQITKVFSVDLVASPATTHGMFESNTSNTGGHNMEWNELTSALLLAHRPDVHAELLKEGKKSRDTEVNDLIEQNQGLKKKVDEYEVKEVAAKKIEKVNQLIETAKLPKEAITDTFKESLQRAADEDIQKLIDDRKQLIESAKGGVRGMGSGKTTEGNQLTKEQAKTALLN